MYHSASKRAQMRRHSRLKRKKISKVSQLRKSHKNNIRLPVKNKLDSTIISVKSLKQIKYMKKRIL